MTEKKPEAMNKAMTVARIYYQKNLSDPAAQAFLGQRGLSVESVWRFELGYAPDAWRGLVDHFTSHSIRLAAKDAGILTTMSSSDRLIDMFRGRFMFPIHTMDGALVGYGGRIISEGKDAPKYINTPETPLFQKSKLLYGLYQNKKHISERREAMLVEGYMDVVSTTAAGLPITLAPMGTALTSEQLHLLQSVGVRKLWMCLDGDKAGIRATERNLQVIMADYHPALDVRLITLPDDHDPDSYIRKFGLDEMKARMSEAAPLPSYIDSVCRKGLPERLGLEDKACYLLKLEGFLEASSGALREDLLKLACTTSGLKPEQIAEGKYARDSDHQVSEWHPLVALAARWMWHEDSTRIAERMAAGHSSANGMGQLIALANVKCSGCAESFNQCQNLHAYALAHGPLSEAEMTELSSRWPAWRKQQALDESLTKLRTQPFDASAKQSIRQVLSL